jgi:hypothetical protein
MPTNPTPLAFAVIIYRKNGQENGAFIFTMDHVRTTET